MIPSGNSLEVFFKPKHVAVIGATETKDSVGRTILWNLISTPFGGTVFPVNPKRPSVLGIKAYPSIAAVPQKVDLAVIVTPASTVHGLIEECVAAGVKGVIIISAGFKETGPAGLELERQILETARRGKVRIIGPNCLGVMSPLIGLNATFAGAMAHAGGVGFISQSGALCTAILDWSLKEMVGFSAFVSIGSMLDVGWGDLIQYLGDDPHTRSIVIYMESIGNAKSFLSAAREVAMSKPIVVIKPGRSEAASRAAASHTGSLTGSDEVLDAAFRRCGVLRVNSISDLFDMSEVIGRQPRPKGPKLTIITNAGGPGVLATDALVSMGGELSVLSDESIQAYNEVLPPHWSHNNPVDILGDAGPERYAKAVEIAASDPASDGLLVILTPQAMTDPTMTAEHLKPYADLSGKPILASWMGGDDVIAGENILNRAGIPTFPYPDAAARAFHYLWQYSYNLRGLYETPTAVEGSAADPTAITETTKLLKAVRAEGRELLTEEESKRVLAAYGIPTVTTSVATSEDDAVEAANEIGYPVVLKLHSHTITHKTDVGGVQLNLPAEKAVRDAYQRIRQSVGAKVGLEHFEGVTVQPMIRLSDGYELILGSSVDSQFGPVLLFGTGGQLVEVFKDRSLALPPLNTTLARRMMEQTKIFKALKGVRGREPVDLQELDGILVKFSRLVCEQPWIKEMDINPLLVSADRIIALDARVVVHGQEICDQQLPATVIRPYPLQYVWQERLKDGSEVTVRPIGPEDEPLIKDFHKHLSEQTIYFRYFRVINYTQRVAHERLTKICFIDYDREIAIVAERTRADGEREILAVGRLAKSLDQDEGEFAVIVADHAQRLGLGTIFLRRIVEMAKAEKMKSVVGNILTENVGMLKISERLGFKIKVEMGEEVATAVININ
ncbi:MAG: bifunctional acetate--CoA ligase family protein/GNAT family N-acetyltransferase [Bryobacteraceae bacterium]